MSPIGECRFVTLAARHRCEEFQLFIAFERATDEFHSSREGTTPRTVNKRDRSPKNVCRRGRFAWGISYWTDSSQPSETPLDLELNKCQDKNAGSWGIVYVFRGEILILKYSINDTKKD